MHGVYTIRSLQARDGGSHCFTGCGDQRARDEAAKDNLKVSGMYLQSCLLHRRLQTDRKGQFNETQVLLV